MSCGMPAGQTRASQLLAGRLVQLRPEYSLQESTLYAVFRPDRLP
jgi:hypothetical protein